MAATEFHIVIIKAAYNIMTVYLTSIVHSNFKFKFPNLPYKSPSSHDIIGLIFLLNVLNEHRFLYMY